jgi:hypothetical protein
MKKAKVQIPKPIRNFLESAQVEIAENGATPERIERLKREFTALLKTVYFYRDVDGIVDKYITPTLLSTYKSKIEQSGILQVHFGVSPLQLIQLKPHLQEAVKKRVQANKRLITDFMLETETKAVNSVVSNWLNTTSQTEILSDDIMRGMLKGCTEAVSNYEISRRAIDQQHKLIADFNNVIAVNEGAIAGVWHSHKKTATYMARPEHEKLNGQVFVIKNNSLVQQGLLKKGGNDWLEDLKEQPAQLINCTCYFVYYYIHDIKALFRLKPDIFTEKGKAFFNVK